MPPSPDAKTDEVQTDPPRPRQARSPLRWVPIVLLILVLPVLIFAGVRRAYDHLLTKTETPGTRQLRTVGVAVRRYAQEHGGNYPPSLQAMVDDGTLPPAMRACPGGHVGYEYLGGGLNEQQATNGTVLVYEPVAANAGRGSAFLYADGSTAWITADAVKQELDMGLPPTRRTPTDGR